MPGQEHQTKPAVQGEKKEKSPNLAAQTQFANELLPLGGVVSQARLDLNRLEQADFIRRQTRPCWAPIGA